MGKHSSLFLESGNYTQKRLMVLIEALSNEIVLKILQQRFNARFLAGHTKRYFLINYKSYRKILALSFNALFLAGHTKRYFFDHLWVIQKNTCLVI